MHKNSQNVSMSHSLSEQRSGQSRKRLHVAFLLIRCEKVFNHKTPSVNFYPAFSFINFLLFFNILFFKEDFSKINIEFVNLEYFLTFLCSYSVTLLYFAYFFTRFTFIFLLKKIGKTFRP